jgi:signal transduction histidine kinase
MAKENGVQVRWHLTEQNSVLNGDPVQITRAIQNVIINAIQASTESKGQVEVSCIRKDFYVDVLIADTGHGIQPDQIAKIFDPYFTTKQGKSGTGLGLYITKKVVEDHGGSIKVDSTPGAGTTITIRLPLLNT